MAARARGPLVEALIRLCLKGEPLWMIEQYWQGYP